MTGRSIPIVPRGTHRLQFPQEFGFEDARRTVPIDSSPLRRVSWM